MSGAKHTPGPWKIGERGPSTNYSVRTEAERPGFIGAVAYPHANSGTDERYANALLMATAPELADALEACLTGFGADDIRLLLIAIGPISPVLHERCERLRAAHQAARAALRKAGRLP